MPLSRKLLLVTLLGIALVMTGCDSGPDSSAANSAGHSAPTATTGQANQEVLDQRPFENRDDFENARRRYTGGCDDD
jgi:alkyl sulfatase BDS1-like metallo-beta-lactamase superfamily hydrolase